MKHVWMFVFIGFVAIVFTYLFISSRDQAVIKYFPIDDSHYFTEAATTLTTSDDEDNDEIKWEIASSSNDSMYLRQDVSLLYVNGRLKGVVNKWKENAQHIEKQTILQGEDSKKYEAISFHHGEIHGKNDEIKSIQTTTTDTLYIIDSPHSKKTAFHKAQSTEEKEWTGKLDHAIDQQLEAQWDELIHHYQIPREKYIHIPLTELTDFSKEDPFPGTTGAEFERILGQLWEGLYKNYVLGIEDSQSKHPIQSYIPLILLDKNGKHLIVLYEDDAGEKHQLIQYY
ncbi:hypothetical protein MUO14_01685 [Halobacillus shinanisalinarum]|uniref:Uncharacterized protein n=1 Tax=Halobacillus shinanisalinarum TaxID=2932258 RepID=A0ABY4H0B9_9BACI|nr:hypothetical protein [Halobacillus shinanisalinarum]UOQ93736.1 hypothetical protein MUO14_01685 [Halobacillus shinanisalinarum]